jgi:lysozyme family protein
MIDMFTRIIPFILENEGCKFVIDSGGPTRHGITLSTLRQCTDFKDGFMWGDLDQDGDIDADDVKLLSPLEAREIYLTQWWNRYGYARLAHPDLAAKVLDLSVNMGPYQAHQILQRAINFYVNGPVAERLKVDGILGDKTIAAVQKIGSAGMDLVTCICYEAWSYYQKILVHPKYAENHDGWRNRAFLIPLF